jgi:hypothetical protein
MDKALPRFKDLKLESELKTQEINELRTQVLTLSDSSNNESIKSLMDKTNELTQAYTNLNIKTEEFNEKIIENEILRNKILELESYPVASKNDIEIDLLSDSVINAIDTSVLNISTILPTTPGGKLPEVIFLCIFIYIYIYVYIYMYMYMCIYIPLLY